MQRTPSRLQALDAIDPSQCRRRIAAHSSGRACTLLPAHDIALSGSTDGSLAMIPLNDTGDTSTAGMTRSLSTAPQVMLVELLPQACANCRIPMVQQRSPVWPRPSRATSWPAGMQTAWCGSGS